MQILQTVVGSNGGPQAGQTQYQHEAFRNSVVQMIVVNNVTECPIGDSPGFTHNPYLGIVSRPNPWLTSDIAVFFYSPC